YWSAALVALVPAGVVTVTSTTPAAAPVGAVTVIEVSLLTVKLAAAIAPKLTAVAPRKFVPVIVTTVPPASGPLLGETLMTVGGGVMPFPFNGTIWVAPGTLRLSSVGMSFPLSGPEATGEKLML